MNAREFCREPGYGRAVLFTYEFSAPFFERVVLRDLLAGGTTDIQVVADLGRATEVQERWIGQVRSLGKRYRLNFANIDGAFHPKILLKTGDKGAIVWIGSGNITHGGWQTNLEVGTAWKVGPDFRDRGSWLNHVLRDLALWIPADPEGSALARVRASSWLTESVDALTSSPVLISQENASLGTQIVNRWAGRAFDKVTIATGSTDEGGALLGFFHKNFGVTQATILLNPENASFKEEKISALPLMVQLLKPADNRRVHAKCYWFTGPTGPAAIIGSANCSSAAWLLLPRNKGNVESVVVYDNPSEADYQSLLKRFSAEETLPAVLLVNAEPPEDPPTLTSYPIADVTWEHTRGELAITFTTPPPRDASVLAEICGVENPCETTANELVWIANPDPMLLKSKLSVTGTVVIVAGPEKILQKFWVNDLGDLQVFADGQRFVDPITGLRNARTSSEQQKIVNALQSLANMILTDQRTFTRDFPGDARRAKLNRGGTKEETIPATDPEVLIRSIDDLLNQAKGQPGAYGLYGISLTGVMRTFFEFGEEQADLAPIPEPEIDPVGPPKAKQPPAKPSTPPPPPKATRVKLHKQLAAFKDRFRSEDFAKNCSAEQLIQAAAYLLGIVVYGVEGGWFEADDAKETVTTVIDILVWKDYPKRGVGLLDTVRRRYNDSDKSEDFRLVVGDGTLWAAMLAALWKTPWEGVNASLQKGLAMRAVLTCQNLLSTAPAVRLAALLRGLGPMFIPSAVLDESVRMNSRLTKLEEFAIGNWDRLEAQQQASTPQVREGDVHYHYVAGWVFTIKQSGNSAKNGLRFIAKTTLGS